MYSEKARHRVENIAKKIDFIENIVKENSSIVYALEDERFDKLLHSGELEILTHFEKQDIKGSYELHIVEEVIRERLPVITMSVNSALKK